MDEHGGYDGSYSSAFDDVANPRLTEAFGLGFDQDDVEFAIPRLTRDIPLSIDPFLLWKSSNEAYREQHGRLLAFFEIVRTHALAGRVQRARDMLTACREPRSLGLGYAKGSKAGSAIGPQVAADIVDAITDVPQLTEQGFDHIEVIGLVVSNVAEDRISDLTGGILKQFFVDYTARRALDLGVPTLKFVDMVFDFDEGDWRRIEAQLPYHPIDRVPLLFAPLDLLRHLPWINYDNYYKSPFARYVLEAKQKGTTPKPVVLARNRENYKAVEAYVNEREKEADRCNPDPLFKPLGAATLRSRLRSLKAVPTGTKDGADKEYEDHAATLLTSLLFPGLRFADTQSRTEGGTHIRDLVFYNGRSNNFTKDLHQEHGCVQVVFEFKNVAELSGTHVNQVLRYLDEKAGFGNFGVLVSRHPPTKALLKNLVDLHSSKRKVVVWLDDDDLEEMVQTHALGESALSVLHARYLGFMRRLPK